MKNINPTFDHITFQSGNSVTQAEFKPEPHAQLILNTITGKGIFDITGFRVEVTQRPGDVVEFSISQNGLLLVSCFACFDPSKILPAWSAVTSYCTTCSTYPDGVFTPWIGPARCSAPIRPFLLIAFAPALFSNWEVLLMLGDLERCIYWRLHQIFAPV